MNKLKLIFIVTISIIVEACDGQDQKLIYSSELEYFQMGS